MIKKNIFLKGNQHFQFIIFELQRPLNRHESGM
jgi:hypothetical protein